MGNRTVRVLMVEASGDALGAFRTWRKREPFLGVTHEPFSTQFFDVCAELGATAKVLVFNNKTGRETDGQITVEHRKSPFAGKSGLTYKLAHAQLATIITAEALRFRADVAFVHNEPHPFLLAPLARAGVAVVPALHNVLWPIFEAPSAANRLLFKADARFYRKHAAAIMAVSEAILGQVQSLAGPGAAPFVGFLPTFSAATFEGIAPAEFGGRDREPFRLLFAGRVEEDKGVFDLLEMTERLSSRGRHIQLDICGTGSADGEMERRIAARGLSEQVHKLGWCDRAQMQEAFSRCHAVVVPTRTSFVEGFNMVVAEGLLAGRPVITSKTCPAIDYAPGAVVEVPPNDAAAYADAIEGLLDSPARYAELVANARAVAVRFHDTQWSYRAALRHVLDKVAEGRPIDPRQVPVTRSAA